MNEQTNELMRRLENAQNKIENAEKDLNKSEGKLSVLKDSLKQLTGTDDPVKAEKLIKNWNKEVTDMAKNLEKLLDEIEETMENADHALEEETE